MGGGCAGQAGAAAAMVLAAPTLTGAPLGWTIVVLLAVLGASRSLASISSKDVLAKTVPKGRRGRVTGLAASVAGLVTIGTGLSIRALAGEDDAALFGVLLAAAAASWVAAAVVITTIGEHAEATEAGGARLIREAIDRLRTEPPLRRFVVVRTMLFVTTLSPPYLAVLAARRRGSGLAELGVFVVASGLASLLGSPVWGRHADRSSRSVMRWSGWAGVAIIAVVLVANRVEEVAASVWSSLSPTSR